MGANSSSLWLRHNGLMVRSVLQVHSYFRESWLLTGVPLMQDFLSTCVFWRFHDSRKGPGKVLLNGLSIARCGHVVWKAFPLIMGGRFLLEVQISRYGLFYCRQAHHIWSGKRGDGGGDENGHGGYWLQRQVNFRTMKLSSSLILGVFLNMHRPTDEISILRAYPLD